MYTVAEYTGQDAIRYATQSPPYGMGLAGEAAKSAKSVIVYGSSFSDPGEDFTRWVALNGSGTILSTVTIEGY